MSGGPVSVDTIIKGVSTLDDLLQRPHGDGTLDSHLIGSDSSQVNED